MALVLYDAASRNRLVIAKPQRLSFGRALEARVVLPEDAALSSLHFVLDWDGECCVLENYGLNGTFVNHRPVASAALRDGDEIVAGRTRFVLRVEHDARGLQGLLFFGGWSADRLPPRWELVEGFGFKRWSRSDVAVNLGLLEDSLERNQGLSAYLNYQLLGLDEGLPGVIECQQTEPDPVQAGDEAIGLKVVLELSDHPSYLLMRQTYVRAGRLVGILTVTLPEVEEAVLKEELDWICSGLEFRQSAPPAVADLRSEDSV